MDILEAQVNAQRAKRAHALATIVKADGATPRGVGSKMLVFEDGSIFGSIGGGILEKQVIGDAVKCLMSNESALSEYENRDEGDESPLGVIKVFIEPKRGAPELIVCGAGHVGGCLIRLASTLGYRITALDTRDTEITHENVKQADQFILVDNFYNGVRALEERPRAYYLISTYGHIQDGEALSAVLEKDAQYIGMTGSPPKIAAILNRMRDVGYSEERLAFIHAPVGLDIGGETPAEIAVSIMAEIQMIRYGGTGYSLRGK